MSPRPLSRDAPTGAVRPSRTGFSQATPPHQRRRRRRWLAPTARLEWSGGIAARLAGRRGAGGPCRPGWLRAADWHDCLTGRRRLASISSRNLISGRRRLSARADGDSFGGRHVEPGRCRGRPVHTCRGCPARLCLRPSPSLRAPRLGSVLTAPPSIT